MIFVKDERWARTYAAVMGVEVKEGPFDHEREKYGGRLRFGLGWWVPAPKDSTWNYWQPVPPCDANAVEKLLERMRADGWRYGLSTDDGNIEFCLWENEAERNRYYSPSMNGSITITIAPTAHEAAAEAIACAKGIGE